MLNPESSGKFTTSSNLIVTDPCYSKTAKPIQSLSVLSGEYEVFIRSVSVGCAQMQKAAAMFVFHESVDKNTRERLMNEDRASDWKWVGDAGVDSGQIGLIDESSHTRPTEERTRDHEVWYENVCEKTGAGSDIAMLPGGAFMSTLWGDGRYPVWSVSNHAGRIVGLLIDTAGLYEDEEEPADDDLIDAFLKQDGE